MEIIDELEPVRRGAYAGRRRLRELSGRHGHGDRDPHGRHPRRHAARAGRRRHRARFGARIRVAGNAEQGARHPARGRHGAAGARRRRARALRGRCRRRRGRRHRAASSPAGTHARVRAAFARRCRPRLPALRPRLRSNLRRRSRSRPARVGRGRRPRGAPDAARSRCRHRSHAGPLPGHDGGRGRSIFPEPMLAKAHTRAQALTGAASGSR